VGAGRRPPRLGGGLQIRSRERQSVRGHPGSHRPQLLALADDDAAALKVLREPGGPEDKGEDVMTAEAEFQLALAGARREAGGRGAVGSGLTFCECPAHGEVLLLLSPGRRLVLRGPPRRKRAQLPDASPSKGCGDWRRALRLAVAGAKRG